MRKWIIGALLGFIMQGSATAWAVDGLQLNVSRNAIPLQDGQSLMRTKKLSKRCHHHHHHRHHHVKPCDTQGPMGPVGNPGPQGGGFERFASYWLVNQPSLLANQNVVFNLQQTLQGIQYDPTSGIFTLPAGVYVINYFASPGVESSANFSLIVNGLSIPSPGVEGGSVVVDLSSTSNNMVSVQPNYNWFPITNGDDIQSYFFAYVSIAIYQIGN